MLQTLAERATVLYCSTVAARPVARRRKSSTATLATHASALTQIPLRRRWLDRYSKLGPSPAPTRPLDALIRPQSLGDGVPPAGGCRPDTDEGYSGRSLRSVSLHRIASSTNSFVNTGQRALQYSGKKSWRRSVASTRPACGSGHPVRGPRFVQKALRYVPRLFGDGEGVGQTCS